MPKRQWITWRRWVGGGVMGREFSKSFYKSAAWLKCREGYIKSVGGYCEDCMARGIYKPGVVVHHIVPLTPDNIRDPAIALGYGNLRLVCQDCHAAEHHPSGLRFRFGPDGEILPK